MYTDGFHFRKKKSISICKASRGQSQALAEGYKENIPQRSGPPETNRQGRMDGWFRLIRFLSGFSLCSGDLAYVQGRLLLVLGGFPKSYPKSHQKLPKRHQNIHFSTSPHWCPPPLPLPLYTVPPRNCAPPPHWKWPENPCFTACFVPQTIHGTGIFSYNLP